MSSKLTKTHLTHNTKKADNCFHKCPSATPQKIPIFIINFTVFPNNYVFIVAPNYVGFFGLCLGQNFFSQRKQESKERTLPPPPHPSLYLYFLSHLLSYLSLYYLISFSTYTNPPFFIACPPFNSSLSHIPIFLFSPICAPQLAPFIYSQSFDHLQNHNFFCERGFSSFLI